MQSADFKCLECGEDFEFKAHCVIHHIDTKHQDFQVMGSDLKMIVKS
jgi:hypothetical protein